MSVRATITRDPIDPARILDGFGTAADGAVLLFLGTVRDHNVGSAVDGLTYESYEAMAERELGAIAAEAAERARTDRVAVVHRVGELAVGDVSVAIAVASPHRAEAYDASRHVIEEIKKRLPVWKREHYADADSRWVEGTVPPVPEVAGE